MTDLARDLRHALRRLALTPGFTLLALVTLAAKQFIEGRNEHRAS